MRESITLNVTEIDMSYCRTNYFHVTDEDRYKELMTGFEAEGFEDLTCKADEKGPLHGFSCTGPLDWYPPEDGAEAVEDFNELLVRLQKLLPEDECFILQEIGYVCQKGKLRSVCGCSIVVTNNDIQSLDLTDWHYETARRLLGEKAKIDNIYASD